MWSRRAGILHYHRREPGPTLERAEEALAVCAEQDVGLFTAFADILQGWAFVHRGRHGEGFALMRRGLEGYRRMAGELESPLWLAMLADAHRAVGAPADGLEAVTEGLQLATAMGISFEEAELLRLRGELLLLRDGMAADGAESSFRSALAVATAQAAHALELRAAIGLARMLGGRGQRKAAQEILSATYRWFPAGLETADLDEARALLEEWRRP